MGSEATLYNILSDLRTTGREGTVVVSDGESRKSIYFSRTGVRLLTSGKRRGVRIGEVLLKTGKISQRQLDMVLEKQQKSNLRFGELLYLMCMITEEDIKKAVRVQIEEEIYDLFTWEGQDIRFQEGPPPQELLDPDSHVTNLTFHVGALLDEATRRVKEWEGFKAKLPGPGMTLAKSAPVPGRSEAPLDDRSLSLLEVCDGRRPLEQILESSPMFRFDTLKALAFLSGAGRVQAVRPTSSPAPGGAMKFDRAPSTGSATPGAMRMPTTGTPTPGGLRAATTGSPTPGAMRTPSTGSPTPGARPPITPSPVPSAAPQPPPAPPRPPAAAPPALPGKTMKFGPVVSPGELVGRETKEPSQRFSLEQVPDVDWKGGPKDRQADEPPEPKPMTGPVKKPFLKEETSRLMARSAAKAVHEKLAPPPAAPPAPGGKAGWIAAAVLLLVLGGAAGFEGAARSKFGEADSKARGLAAAGNLEGARLEYEGFAKKWRYTSAAAAAARAAEDLRPAGGGGADQGSAGALRKFVQERMAAAASGGAVEDEIEAARQAAEWAGANGEREVKDFAIAWKARAEAYRSGAEDVRKQAGEARTQGRLGEARELTARLLAEFPRSKAAREAGWPFRVETVPAGARLFVNGRACATTPQVVEVPPGSAAAIRVELAGFETASVDAAAPVPETVSVTFARQARWTARTGGGVTRPVALTSSAVFAVSEDGTLTALGVGAGNFLWRSRPGSHPYVTPPVVARSAVLAGAQNGAVWALDVADGTPLWSTTVGTGLRGTLGVSDDGALAFVASDEGDITTLDVTTGKNLGKVLLDAPVAHGPVGFGATSWLAVLSDGSVRTGTGEQAGWTAKLPAAPSAAARPARAGDAAVFACADGSIVALAGNGSQLWAVKDTGAPLGVAADGDRVVAALSKKVLRCYDLKSGATLWSAEIGGDAAAAPAAAEGVVTIPCDDGVLRAFDGATGSVLWIFRAGSRMRAAPVPARDAMIFGGDDGNVFAVPWK